MSRATLIPVVVSVLLLAACSGGGDEQPAVATATAQATASATPSATATATARATASAPAASPFAAVAALNGLRCIGQWGNTTFGTSGAFAARVEAGGGGGAITFEVGGPVFGGAGGVFEAPFRLQGSALVIEAHSEFLGHMSARIGLDGKAEGALYGPPALGLRSTVTLTDYAFADNRVRFTLRIDFGDGRAPATSVVEAGCSR